MRFGRESNRSKSSDSVEVVRAHKMMRGRLVGTYIVVRPRGAPGVREVCLICLRKRGLLL